ncbi:protein ALTERED PHOSPHATE STARVATION RESPONSE 1-like [Vicia villosa]|uniref:protein ALTERED PHOSPHATE STARVATION RESPONSE 1-like n=1 Tax=Vicia villosa TaxID=3911 RepID=UPI00273BAA78|nr:protein ALTERED PHOSPHATE STARVATION RESPONSE 1-like [Vicia villosa]
MGASSSKLDDDKALQLCRERKKFVRQALDGRCSLAAAYVSYVQSLRIAGTALRKFSEPEAPIESSLYTSTNATPEPLVFNEKTPSQFSFSSPSASQRIDPHENFSPTPSPPSATKFQANHMRFSSSSSKKVEEKPPAPVIGTVTSSAAPQNAAPFSADRSETSAFEDSSLPNGTQPWDFFGLFHPMDHQFSFQEGKGMHRDMGIADDITRLREEEGIPGLEDDEEKVSSQGSEVSHDSVDEFDDEPATDTLVRKFENFNRVSDHVQANGFHGADKPQAGDSVVNGEKESFASPDVSPLKTATTVSALPTETNKSVEKENHSENKVVPKDFFASMKEIEYLFVRASESGKEVPRMLEANKLHFRPIFPGKENSSMGSSFLKACFSCGEDPSQVPEEPAQNSVKYLTWHRTMSSRSNSSRNPLGANSKDDIDNHTNNLFDSFCMISGSHASTLDRLFAWERKLYDEVKASGVIRKEYDTKCKILQHLESKGEKTSTIDKTRAVVKDLHSRIRVAILRIDSISKRIEELRDKELQPQLEELIEGLSRMWETMFDCHKLQFQILSTAYYNNHARITLHSETRKQIASYLESELHFLASSFTKWVGAQKSYLEAINGWLNKCVSLQQKTAKKKRRPQPPLLRMYGPPIYATCGIWLDKLGELPTQEVVDSIRSLASETSRFLPRQEKSHAKVAKHPHVASSWNTDIGNESSDNLLGDDASEDWLSGFDQFRASFIRFLGQLNNFSGSSVKMYTELRQAIQHSKTHYHHHRSNSQTQDDHSKLESKVEESENQNSKQ